MEIVFQHTGMEIMILLLYNVNYKGNYVIMYHNRNHNGYYVTVEITLCNIMEITS